MLMPGQELAEYLAYILASAHRSMRMGLSESIDDSELTEEHWRILHVLSDERGRSMGELAERALLNGPALTKNIDKLVSRGLVQRSVDAQDSRKVLVFISDMGLKTAAWLKKRVDAHHHSLEEALGPQKMMQLKQLLRSFAISAAANSGSPRVSAGAGSTPTSAASRQSALPAKSQRRRKQSR
jgi:MarR family transcriptional regulator, organic hydroperoxide resistance regulator